MGKTKDSSTVVKIDSSLLKRIEDVISKEENKYKFINKKQLIDLAVSEYLKNLEKEGENNKKNGK